MRTLGVSGGWLFFEHAGSAVAVDLTSGDVTDVFSAAELNGHGNLAPAGRSAEERRAALLARSALATTVDPLQSFAVPDAVRANARQARTWTQVYDRPIELPIVAAGESLVPPASVRKTAHRVIDADLERADLARAEHLASGLAANPRIVEQMNAFFARHDKEKTDPEVWASWGGDAGRVWATKVAQASDRETGTISEILVEDKTIDYDTLRLLPRAFSVINGPHTAECDGNGSCSCGGSKSSARYPSSRALTYLALGGDAGRDWAQRAVRKAEAEALVAAAYDPDANVEVVEEVPPEESFDGDAPHVYAPTVSNPEVCTYCAAGEMDPRHQPDAIDYDQADITPDDAHYFSETATDPDKCEICGKAVDDTLHKQAALADYYLNKDVIDKKIAETAEYWATRTDQSDQPPEPVTAAAQMFGVDWTEFDADDPAERAIAADDALNTVFWARRGDEDSDPLTYYAAYTGDDSMCVDQLYVSDGSAFYLYNAEQRIWEQTALATPSQVIELDDDTAREVVRAMSVFPGQPVHLREIDPGETLLMEQAMPGLDLSMLERVAEVTASGWTFGDYTPQERAQNAKRQVRDAGGRFAKSGSRIAVGPQARAGVVSKIDPATQKVQVKFDDNGSSEWVDAKSTRVAPGGDSQPTRTPIEDISKIPAIPRAVSGPGHTPKALLKTMLPPLGAKALNAITQNYPNFIAKERAGSHARREAQKALDAKQKKYWEDQQAKAEADYKRRLAKIHGQGKGLRDWVENLYRKILPQPYRRQAIGHASIEEFAKRRKKDAAPAAPETTAPVAGQPITDPAQSDVAPIYMAEVDEANQNAVLDLLAMIPASTTGTEPQVMRYTSTGWIPYPKMLRQLQSSAPPTIVQLDQAQYADTLTQVKSFYQTPEGKAQAIQEAKDAQSEAIAASIWGEYGEVVPAARADQYWTTGAGAAKVRWGEPGDLTRATRHLKKYLPQPGVAEGYSARLLQQMTGRWPGDARHLGRHVTAAERGALFSTRLLSTREVIDHSALIAAVNSAVTGVEAPEHVTDVPTELAGAPFVIPVLAPVGIKSGDGRSFAPLSLTTRDLPIPLMWQIQTAEGHDSAVIVGRIDEIQRSEDGSLVNARGVFDVGPYGQEAERLVRNQFLRGVSVDLDNFEAEARSTHKPQIVDREKKPDGSDEDEIVRIHADDMVVTNGRVMGATLVAKPAFQEVRIQLEDSSGEEEEAMVADGTYIGTPGSEAETEEMIRSALTAAGIPVHPPLEWFEDPNLKQETPLTVLDDGRVYGHIATWNSDHIGLPFSTRPPRSRSDYAYFHTGLLRTDEGRDVHVGQITLAGGHAPLEANAAAAVKHYDDTASAMCDVHAGEDAYGIWVAGALRPEVSAEQIRAIRASAPSGDWRPINGRLELVAVCQVNVPGFPVTRARVASGQVFALVAAGTATLNRLRADADDAPMDALIARVDALEAPQREALEAAREAALARIGPVREERNAQLAAAREEALNRFSKMRFPEAYAVKERIAALLATDESLFREVSTEKRKNLAKKGHAMPNGGYPIETVGDLKNAIRAYGRAASGEKAAVRRHIRKRARALGKTDLIPESWASLSTPVQEIAGEIQDLAARMALISSGHFAELDDTAEVMSLEELFGRGPGWVTNPKGTARLHDYWTKGEGAAKIRWGQPGDFDRCRREVGSEIGESDPGKLRFINAICAQWHKDATGAMPGKAPAERAASHIDPEADELAAAEADLEELAKLTAAGGRYPNGEPWDQTQHPRDEKGRFRLVIAELKDDLEGQAGTADAVEGLNEAQDAANSGDMDAAQEAARNVLGLVDKIAAKTVDPDAVKTLRQGYTDLADAVANLPLVFGDLNQKYRFSDLPAPLKGLITDLYKRAEEQLSPEDLDKAGGTIQQFTSGIELLSQPEISAELSRILRFLI